MKAIASVAFLVWIAFSQDIKKPETKIQMTTPAREPQESPNGFSYKRDVGWMGYRFVFFALDDAVSDATVTFATSSEPGARPEIGFYERVLAAGKVRRLQQRLQASRYQYLARPKIYQPDTKFVTFREYGPNKPEQWVSFPLDEVPPEIVPVVGEMDAMLDEIRVVPVRAVSIEAKWLDRTVSRRKAVRLEITFENRGSKDAMVANPFAESDSRSLAALTFSLRKGSGGGSFSLVRGDLLHGETAPASKSMIVPAGGRVVFRVQKRLGLVPSTYQGQLAWRGHAIKADDPRVVRGELHTKLPDLVVEEGP